MFAVMDCGTTNTRIYIVDQEELIVASGDMKVGVRDTSITGSADKLRYGVTELFYRVLEEHGIPREEIKFMIASGMITSEIGLMEIPHLIAPVGLEDLSKNIVKVTDQAVLPIHCPVYFVRGIKNDAGADPDATRLREMDFMRGEEVQCVGIMERYPIPEPHSIVALSSHTKIVTIDQQKRICASTTTISGQFYELMVHSTNIGKSLIPQTGEEAGGYGYEQMIDIACDCVRHAGLGRTMLMPRFLQVLLKTNSSERSVFLDAAIAADDLKAFEEMRAMGYPSQTYILYGHADRCRMYTYLLKKAFGEDLQVISISDSAEIGQLTVRGAIKVALRAVTE